MKLLYVHGTTMIQGIIAALCRLNIDITVYPKRQTDVFLNEEEAEELGRYMEEHGITHAMSVHLIDTLAVAAGKAGVKYIAVVWDAPYLNIFTKYGRMRNCYFSVFDKVDHSRFVERGIQHVLYQPLAVDDVRIRDWDSEHDDQAGERYLTDICFVGNLYEDNFYDVFCRNIPQILQDYFMGIFERAAFRWDGINRVYGSVNDELIAYMKKTVPDFQMINFFEIPDRFLFETGYLMHKITNIERICILNLLAERHEVTFYTASKTDVKKLQGVKIMPPVGAGRAAHRVFQRSKINLNVSLKGIEGGTPQRIMDIMGAGGFVITSYSPETAELFEEDREIVMFKTLEELLEKVDFYLEHETEREEIAQAGHEKVMRCYTYQQKMQKLIEWVEKEI